MNQYRELLEARGFEVASRSFTGRDGRPWHYARHLPVDGIWNSSTRPGRQYFVQLDAGDWQRWGDPRIQVWSAGPWHECDETVTTGLSLADWARAEGVEVIEAIGAFGNLQCRYRGHKLFANSSSRCFVLNWRGVIENAHTREQLDQILSASEQQQPRTATQAIQPFRSLQPIQVSGRNCQRELFSEGAPC